MSAHAQSVSTTSLPCLLLTTSSRDADTAIAFIAFKLSFNTLLCSEGLDWVVNEAREFGIRLILTLTDSQVRLGITEQQRVHLHVGDCSLDFAAVTTACNVCAVLRHQGDYGGMAQYVKWAAPLTETIRDFYASKTIRVCTCML